MKAKHVVDVELNAVDKPEAIPEGEAIVMLIKAYEEEQQRLKVEIQIKKVKVLEKQAKIQALSATNPPIINDPATTSTVVPDEPPAGAGETSKSPM
ncbi:hypothetical protein LIER_35400 [Lithospermum erythrorhizon]|uniref:Uncharacterized protein n=1 Tax=Lithospermum erythrorhizon TaxID=34254 RepID=A0AAV3NTX6_LITER